MADKRMQPTWDPLVLAAQLRNIAEQSQRLMQRFVSHQPEAIRSGGTSTLGFDFFELMAHLSRDGEVPPLCFQMLLYPGTDMTSAA